MPIQFIRNLLSTSRSSIITDQKNKILQSREIDHRRHIDSMQLLQSTVSDIIDTASSTAISITEQLKQTEFRLFSLLDSMEDIVVIKDANNRWVTANRAAQELFGFHHYEYLGKTNTELVEQYPHLCSIQNFNIENEDEAWELKSPIRFIDSYITETEERYFDVIKSPSFFENGARKEMMIIGRDITPQYQEQRKTRACFIALNASSDAIVILDQKYNIFFANFKFVSIFDKKGLTEFESSRINLVDIITEFQCKHEAMKDALSQNTIWQSCWNEYEIVGTPIMNGHPEPIYHIIVFKHGAKCERGPDSICSCENTSICALS